MQAHRERHAGPPEGTRRAAPDGVEAPGPVRELAAARYVGGVPDVLIVRLDPDLPDPSYARPGDAGADLHARQDAVVAAGGGRALVPTGVAVAIPEGYAGLLLPRSGLALRHGVTLANSPGLIDSGYRAELAVLLVNTDPDSDFEVRRGDRIAQLVIQRVETATFVAVDRLPGSERGTGGFGHTGGFGCTGGSGAAGVSTSAGGRDA